ncbi:Putative amido hydrolase [Salmonella enterica subsp. enterica]|nr:Putative amido hydrolase [Salmonella enterica subsp. enterica] [Salmonella enterica subsp. enterica serovar Virchow]
MSSWKIAAAQYAPLNASPAEHVAHHLEYIELAARQQCELLVFPSLSLLGCDERNKPLPAPPDEALLQPLTHAADTHHMTIIVGMPVEHNCRFVKGIAIFAPMANVAAHVSQKSWRLYCQAAKRYQRGG